MILDDLGQADRYVQLHPGFQVALDYLRSQHFDQVENGRYELDGDRVVALVSRYTTKLPADAIWESHRKYIDIQFVAAGQERMGWAALAQAPANQTEYDATRDVIFYEPGTTSFEVGQGQFTIYFPEDVHAPGLSLDGISTSEVVKVVVKIAVDR